jgi:hypothetical protein
MGGGAEISVPLPLIKIHPVTPLSAKSILLDSTVPLKLMADLDLEAKELGLDLKK